MNRRLFFATLCSLVLCRPQPKSWIIIENRVLFAKRIRLRPIRKWEYVRLFGPSLYWTRSRA